LVELLRDWAHVKETEQYLISLANHPHILSGVSDNMCINTRSKFRLWDFVVDHSLLESEDLDLKSCAYSLLSDPTIYAYAFFRDHSNMPIMLYPYQDLIINDHGKRVVFVAANQIGKSFTLCLKAIHFALSNPGKTVLMVSRTFTQSKELLLQIRNILSQSVLDYKFSVGEYETKTEIYFKHVDSVSVDGVDKVVELRESRIICVPATGAALGYAVDLLLIDELAFYEDGDTFYYQIGQPRTYATKGQIIAFSNPNGQQGVFWKLYNDSQFHKYRFSFLDRPGNTVDEYNILKSSLTRDKFDSTVNAVFTSPEGSFISLEERRAIQFNRSNYIPAVITQPLFIFYDFAKSRDRTVRAVGVPVDVDGRVKVFVYELKEYPADTPYSDVVDDLKALISIVGSRNVFMVGWDNTGVGRGIEDFINQVQEIGVMCNPVEFSLENKSRIYTSFKFLVEQRRIDLPFVDECDRQLAMLVFKKTSRDYLQVHHESESDRDDFPDAIAGLCSLIINPENPPVSAVII